jgi:serine/threonine protein kinase
MEFISGIRFDEWLKTQAPVKTQKAVKITRAVAETIELCHTHNIGHRDVKPSNIILKDGDFASPYILDFGISFDSRQTVILTREGEMFWNEFIILPECQDLEGGHRDLRSDITALVGLFFSCLTGKPPIVLRDATGRAPHQRHEKLVVAGANSVSEGERLMWFFQKGFAYNLSERFQSMSEFIGELMRFADETSESDLDPIEQFKILNHLVESTDRNVQLIALTKKYSSIWLPIEKAVAPKLEPIQKHSGSFGAGTVILKPQDQKKFPLGDHLEKGHAHSFAVSRHHFGGSAVVLLTGFAIGMDIHLYAASYTHPLAKDVIIEWSKVVVIDESQKTISDRNLNVAVDVVVKSLAHEIRNLTIRGEPK